jgi:hypothetical protein
MFGKKENRSSIEKQFDTLFNEMVAGEMEKFHAKQEVERLADEERVEGIIESYARELSPSISSDEELQNEAGVLFAAVQDVERFDSARDVSKVLKGMRFGIKKIIRPSDMKQIEENEKERQLYAIAEGGLRMRLAYWLPLGSIGGIVGFAASVFLFSNSNLDMKGKIGPNRQNGRMEFNSLFCLYSLEIQ